VSFTKDQDVLDEALPDALYYTGIYGALRCAVLCCAVLCCAVLCCAVLCCAALCCAALCCAVLLLRACGCGVVVVLTRGWGHWVGLMLLAA